MITAEVLGALTNFGPMGIAGALLNSGYKNEKFTGARFLGITNGGQFCYLCTYKVEGGTDSCKVFLTYNHATGVVTADY